MIADTMLTFISSKRWFRRVQCAALVGGLWMAGTASNAIAEDWTSLEGVTIQGAFLGLWENRVALRLTDGRRVVVPLEKLNAESRLQAEDLAKAKAEFRADRIREISSDDSKPMTVVTSTPLPPYTPFPLGADLQTTVDHVFSEVQKGHVRAFWDLLPPSYQKDVEDLVRLAAENFDEKQTLSSLRLTGQLARTLSKQQDFVFGYPKLSFLPPEMMTIMGKVYSPAVGILTELGDAKMFSPETLKTTPLSEIIEAKNASIGPHIAALIRDIPAEQNPFVDMLNMSGVVVETQAEDRGTLQWNDAQGNPQSSIWVKVDGRWLPNEIVIDWQKFVTETRQSILEQADSMRQASAASGLMVTTVNAALIAIEDAETQEEFNLIVDQYLNPLLSSLGPLMQSGQGNQGGLAGGGMGAMPPGAPGGMPNIGGPGSISTPGSTPSSGGSGPPVAPADVSN